MEKKRNIYQFFFESIHSLLTTLATLYFILQPARVETYAIINLILEPHYIHHF